MYTKIILNLAFMAGITATICLCIMYPFLPGDYDSLAVPVSTAAQTFGVVGMILVPVGVLWLTYELWKQERSKQHRPTKARRYTFALIALATVSLVAVAVTFVAFATGGLLLGLIILLSWLYILSRLIPRLRMLKRMENENFISTPLYFVVIPVAILLFQLATATSAAESSRNHAITMSAEMINDIEDYYTKYGHYPVSLLAVWKDYYPQVVGIEKFHYAPHGDAFNLFFEQPKFLFDNIGTREYVVYNKLDEHMIISHASWILILDSTVVAARQGWYAVHNTSTPHWKYFWFD